MWDGQQASRVVVVNKQNYKSVRKLAACLFRVPNRAAEADRMELSYAKTAGEVLEYFSVKESTGLSGDEVERMRQKYGPNGEQRVVQYTALDCLVDRHSRFNLCEHIEIHETSLVQRYSCWRWSCSCMQTQRGGYIVVVSMAGTPKRREEDSYCSTSCLPLRHY